MRFRTSAVVLCFAVVDFTYGGSLYFPDCLNAGSATDSQPSSPCAQIYNKWYGQVQSNAQQAGFYPQQSQITNNEEQLLQRMGRTEDSQNNQFQNLNGVSPMFQGKGEESGRFRREIPHQVPYRLPEYDRDYYNPYQGSSMIKMLAGLYSQPLGVQQNAYQPAGFNQFEAPQYSQQTRNPFQYNANNQPAYWLNGYGLQSDQNFQNPLMQVSRGFQMINQNMYGYGYPSISQFNPMGGLTRYSNYPESGYSNPLGRCTSTACGAVPVCAIKCQSSVSPEAQQSQWIDYAQLKQRLAEYAMAQLSGRSLGRSDATTQAIPVYAQTTIARSVARNLGTEPTPPISPTVTPMKQETPVSHASSQRVLGLQTPEGSSSDPATPPPTPSKPLETLPVQLIPSAATSEHPIAAQTQPTPLLPSVTPSYSSLTYAPRQPEDESSAQKPVKASRSILEE